MTIHEFLMSKIPDMATRRRPQFSAKTWFRIPSKKLYKFPIEPILKFLAAVVGAVLELSLSCKWKLRDEQGQISLSSVESYSRATLFLMFGLVGVSEVLESIRRLKFSRSGPFIALSLAYLSNGILFSMATESSSAIENKFHLLLYCTAFSTFFVTLLETWNIKSFPLSFTRCFLTVLQGTWLFHTSFAVYGPNSWQINKGNVAIVPVVFMWHVLALFVSCMLLHSILSCAVNRYRDSQDQIFNNGQFGHGQRKEDSIPLGIVVNGNKLYDVDSYDVDSTDDDTLYP